MRILRTVHTFNPAVGGPIESVKQSAAALARLGHEVEIVALDAPDSQWLGDSPVKVHAVGPARGSYAYTPELPRWLKQHHQEYDAVIVHGLWQYNSFAAWSVLRGTETPYFVFPHGMLDPWFKQAYPLKHIKKVLYWPWGEYRVLRDAAAVLFTSEEERRLARNSFRPYHCNERVVSYGTATPTVDLAAAREEFHALYPQLRGKRFVLFLGRIHNKKGCELLLEAFERVEIQRKTEDPAHLLFAGPSRDADYLADLKRRAEASPLKDRIHFSGMLTGNAKWGALSAADAFVLPSHQENFGIAVAEALACGTPVLISNKVNIWREILEDGAGFADDDDVAGTVRLLEQWNSLGEPEKDTMRALTRKCFADRFEIERATNSLLQVLSDFQRGK